MRTATARRLLRLYPSAWRRRYGEELLGLLEQTGSAWWAAWDVVQSAAREHVAPSLRGGLMKTDMLTFRALSRKPSAFLPLLLSLAALLLVLSHVALYGAAREADEDATAHLWQLLMVVQLPLLVFFALKWLPRIGRRALPILALQVGALLAACAPVLLLGL